MESNNLGVNGRNDDALLTSGNRIKQLNDIDKDVTRLLKSAGLAVKALTIQGPSQKDGSALTSTMEQQKDNFASATSQYFSLLSSVDVRLRRQIYALEEANIISAEVSSINAPTSLTAQPLLAGMPSGTSAREKTHGGSSLGNLDIGWLNSRNNSVGTDMEIELCTKAQGLLGGNKRQHLEGLARESEDIDMEHDEVVPVAAI